MAQQHLYFGTAAANDGEYINTAFQKIDDNFDDLYGVQGLTAGVNTGAVRTANTAAIQEAIDAVYDAGTQVIRLPPGTYYCDPGIYLDAPGNLRSDITTPTLFGFSLHLKGAGGSSNHEFHGTHLAFIDNTTNALIVGPGQGMRVSELCIMGPSGATSRAALPANGKGIALSGGSGGASRILLDNVAVENFYEGISQGFNTSTLCDALTLFKCLVGNCYRGHAISGNQNYINTHEDCVFFSNTTHVYSPLSKPVNIIGGNYSTSDGKRKAFTVSIGAAALTQFTDSAAGSSFTNASFNVTISSPDQPLADGAYDAFVINTTEFGLIPLTLISYSAGIASFKFDWRWLNSNWFPPDLFGTGGEAALETALHAATTLYACETVRQFHGSCFKVIGPHIENTATLTCLLDADISFGGDIHSSIDRPTFNYTISHDDQASGGADDLAVFYCQQAFPFLNFVTNTGFAFEMSNFKVSMTNRVLVSFGYGNNGGRLTFHNCTGFNPNVQVPFSVGNLSGSDTMVGAGHGMIEWDSNPYTPTISSSYYGYQAGKLSHAPFYGYFPAPYAQLKMDSRQLADYEDGLGAAGTYTPVFGGTSYTVMLRADDPMNTLGATIEPTATRYAQSNHVLWSWGQNLSNNWSYYGRSNILRVASTSLLFQGLKATIDNGGGDLSYVVNGVYPTLGYVTLAREQTGLNGTAGTNYTGSTIKQESYSFSRTGTLPSSKFATNNTAGATTAAVGDLTGALFVNLKLTAVGAANFTTRTAAEMFGDVAGCYAGFHYMVSISNTNAGTTTLNAGSNVTINGTATIAQNTVRYFDVTFPTATTCTFESRGVTSTL